MQSLSKIYLDNIHLISYVVENSFPICLILSESYLFPQ